MRVSVCFVFKQKTAYEMRISDWSSDVCSSDLAFRLPHREDDEQSSPDQLSADDDSSRGSGSTAGVIGMSRLTPRGNLGNSGGAASSVSGGGDRKSVV